MATHHGGAHRSAGQRASEPERGWFTAQGTRIALLAAVTLVASVGAVSAVTASPNPSRSARWAEVVSPPAQAAVVSTVVPSIAVLGDSVPAGTGCDCVDFAHLLANVAASSASGKSKLLNAARSGLTSTGLLGELDDTASGTRSSLASASIVTVTIGANDFEESEAQHDNCGGASNTVCYARTLTALGSNMHAVLGRIQTFTPKGAQLLVTGYWNVFLDGDVGAKQGAVYVATSDALTREVNAVLQRAARDTGATYVDLYGPFKGAGDRDDTPLLAADGDHPSEAGHRLIASVLARAVGLNPGLVTESGLRWGTE